MKRLIARFVALSFARPLLVLMVFVGVGTLSGALASRLVFRGSFVELLPSSAREVQDLELVSKKAGGDGYLVVQLTGDTPEKLREFAARAAPLLEQRPEVRYVEYRYDVAFFQSRGLLLLPAEKLRGLREDLAARLAYEKKTANPLFVDLGVDAPPPSFKEIEKKYGSEAPTNEYLTSADGKELYLFLKPTGFAGDLDYCSRLLKGVEQALTELRGEQLAIRFDFAGAYKIRIEEDALMRRDLGRASILSALIAIGLILLATRKGSALLVVGGPVVVGIAVTFAVAQLTIGHVNVVTGFLVAILIGLGIEYGVHLAMRYWEERRLLPAQQAMETAVSGTFVGALTSAVTNAAAFFVLIFAKFHAFAQFGFIAGVGVLLTVVSAYAVGPAVLALAERIRPLRSAPPERAAQIENRRYVRWPTALIAGIAVAVLGFAGFSAYVAPSLGFESDLRRLKGHSPATELDDHISQQLGVKITPALFWVKDTESASQVAKYVRESIAQHGNKSAFQKVLSLHDLVPQDVDSRLAEIAQLKPMLAQVPKSIRESGKLAELEKMLDVKPYGVDEVPLVMRRRFQALDGDGTFVLLFPKYSMYDVEEIKAWATQIDEVVKRANSAKIDVHVLDGNLIASRILSLVKGDGPYILWSAALVVFLMILLSLRSLTKALLVAVPLFIGMACLAGAMHLFGVRLNFINAVALPNLLAIAVDNSIHLFHRYEEEGPGSLGHVVRHTGLAAVVATLSNAAGYGALLVASHQGLRSIGQLATLGVACTFLGTTVLFPCMLALRERLFLNRRAERQVKATVRELRRGRAESPSGNVRRTG